MIAHKKTQEKPASTMSGGFLLLLGLAGFVAAVVAVHPGHHGGGDATPMARSCCSISAGR